MMELSRELGTSRSARIVPEPTIFVQEPTVREPVWEPVLLPGRMPFQPSVTFERVSGDSSRERLHEHAGLLVDGGSLAADALEVPKLLGMRGEAGTLLTIVMGQGDVIGYTGQAEIVEVEATNATVEFSLLRAEGDAAELDKISFTRSAEDKPLGLVRGKVHAVILRLEKDRVLLGVERTKAERGTVFIGGLVSKRTKK